MSRFLPRFMSDWSSDATNYALAPRTGTDLSLVSGPCPWDDVVRTHLAAVGADAVGPYRKPAQDPALVAAIAAREGLDEANLWLTAGADNGIELVLGRYLAAGGRLGILVPNFPRFAIVGSTLANVEIETFATLDGVPAGLDVAAVCSPCNPTTCEVGEDQVRRALTDHPDTLFCIDAVFSWYGTWNPAVLCRDFGNVVVLKSYSKIGLAGLRLGYLAAAPELVAEIRAGRSPFSVPAVSQELGLAVERSLDRLAAIRAHLDGEAAWLASALGPRLRRAVPVPFYELEVAGDSTTATRRLAGQGIVVVDGRNFAGMPPDRLRVAIGTREQNETLVRALEALGLLD